MYAKITVALASCFFVSTVAFAADKAKPLPKPKRMPTSTQYDGACYDLSPTSIPGIDEIFLHIPKTRGQAFKVAVNAFNNSGRAWDKVFHCAREKDRTITCRGDDDSGTFTLSIQMFDATMRVSSMIFGNPDDEGPEVLPAPGKAFLKLTLPKVSCN